MDTIQLLILTGGVFTVLVMMIIAFAGPSTASLQKKRIEALKMRHGSQANNAIEQQMRRIIANRDASKSESLSARLIPNPQVLRKRLDKTGRNIPLGRFVQICVGIAVVVMGGLMFKGAPFLIALLLGVVVGFGIPHMVVSSMIGKRGQDFAMRFPDAIDLMVRGLRSGLPISETLGVVASEIPGTVGQEFRSVSDRIKIGKTMDASLQETAERLGTPEVQFFAITLQIQRETGGNLAETLGNLSDVLRKRAMMKLKIKAMSSESKASAYIIGSLPFLIFIGLYMINPVYMGGFFYEPRLMVAMGVAGGWMSIGAVIMAKMISFEI